MISALGYITDKLVADANLHIMEERTILLGTKYK